ncbi:MULTISPECIES: SIS domain-containing protein [unclassified Roseateles]|uniref:SIS domain-containing protein n=1 Tax=unclassified Roseateles TaxID=2626991 RepID=UPI000701F269|nr:MULTISPECIES: SIS domain-containing protein [unclassified Roseateles]KQW48262.1 tagatose-6-phosphate ketose isomerase [Pelomonas sp. Root405]KRA75413.1 tagatose-6-phosphate ketose isomerase [Pelomonas sp. Root662]
MTLLHLDPTDLDHRGAAHTAREIAHQPAVWQTVYAQLQAERPALDAFLNPLLALPQLRIVLTGAGSSAFIGQCIAPALLRQLGQRPGIRVEAVATTDIVSSPEQCLQPEVPTLLVSFARSGNSPESLAAVELADRFVKTCHHLVITCAADGTLNRRMAGQPRAQVLLLPDETNDRAFAMTSSFSGMLLAAAWAFGLPLAPVTALAQAAAALVAAEADRLYALTDKPFERIVYLGSNTLLGLAREAALKLLELTDGKLVAMADSTLGFRHGPKTILNDKTLVVIIVSNDPYTRQYDLDLLRELRQQGPARVLALRTSALNGAEAPHADDVTLALPASAPDLALAPVALVFAQCLALLASLQLGITPDNPSASGTVTRVVSGVTIHPVIEQQQQP